MLRGWTVLMIENVGHTCYMSIYSCKNTIYSFRPFLQSYIIYNSIIRCSYICVCVYELFFTAQSRTWYCDDLLGYYTKYRLKCIAVVQSCAQLPWYGCLWQQYFYQTAKLGYVYIYVIFFYGIARFYNLVFFFPVYSKIFFWFIRIVLIVCDIMCYYLFLWYAKIWKY